MGIHHVRWPDGIASTGSLIGVAGARGKGVGTEAKLMLLYHAFMILGIRKVISDVKAFNAQSAGHLMKCGYRPVGRYRRHNLHEGRYVDQLNFEIFREDWEPVWEKYQKNAVLPSLTDTQRAYLKKACC
jgi:RimJ/RimL family protein N-acetyltransferase